VTTETTMSQRVSEERVFRALSDSHRRELLDLLHAQDGRTLSELDSHLPMTRFGTMKHLRMLESAGLVITRRAGRKKLHYLNAEPIRRAYLHWIRKYAEADPRDPDSLPEGSASPGGARAALQHVYEVLVRTSPAKLWEAITSPEFTPGYFFGTRVSSEWRPGARLTYAYPDGRLAAEGTVLEVNPPLRLVHTFSALWDERVAADREHRVTWKLEPMGPVCRVVMENTGFEGDTATFRSLSGGTSVILNGLKTLLETGEPLPIGG